MSAAWEILSPDERARAERFVTAELRERFVLARGSLRALLARELAVQPARLRFRYGDAGKPALEWPAEPISFNLSHTGDIALLGICRCLRNLGVDVERHCWRDHLDELAERFFSPAECLQLRSYAPQSRVAAFYRCWVRKEAYIKAVGAGLQIDLASFQVSLDDPARLVHCDAGDAARWRMAAFSIAADLEAAVVYDGPAADIVLLPSSSAQAVLSLIHCANSTATS